MTDGFYSAEHWSGDYYESEHWRAQAVQSRGGLGAVFWVIYRKRKKPPEDEIEDEDEEAAVKALAAFGMI